MNLTFIRRNLIILNIYRTTYTNHTHTHVTKIKIYRIGERKKMFLVQDMCGLNNTTISELIQTHDEHSDKRDFFTRNVPDIPVHYIAKKKYFHRKFDKRGIYNR